MGRIINPAFQNGEAIGSPIPMLAIPAHHRKYLQNPDAQRNKKERAGSNALSVNSILYPLRHSATIHPVMRITEKDRLSPVFFLI